MTVDTAIFPKAFAVWFKDVERWDVSSFQRIRWHWPKELMTPIGSVLRMRKEKADRKSYKFSDLQPITIHFDGSMDKRVVDENREYTMDLWFARPGDIVVAKIDLKNGAVGIVPQDWKNAVVTGHFAVYEPDRSKLLPEYLHLVIQANFFKAHLWRNKVGAEGRKEVKLEFFENEEIPLPPLTEQKAIVAQWRKAQDEIAAARERVEKRKAAIDARLFADLGLNAPNQNVSPKCFAVWWKNIEKWGIQQIFQTTLRSKNKSKYKEFSLSELCKIGSGGTPSRGRKDFYGGSIPWVKTGEVINGEITTTEETLTEEGVKNSSAKIYPKGSLLVAMYGQGATRGRTAKLGINAATNQACAVLHELSPKIETDFLWCFLMSQYDSMRMLASGNNQPNLNAEMIANLQIPLPPLPVQKQIMKRVASGRAEIARESEAADHLTQEITTEVEAMIVGSKPVKG